MVKNEYEVLRRKDELKDELDDDVGRYVGQCIDGRNILMRELRRTGRRK